MQDEIDYLHERIKFLESIIEIKNDTIETLLELVAVLEA